MNGVDPYLLTGQWDDSVAADRARVQSQLQFQQAGS